MTPGYQCGREKNDFRHHIGDCESGQIIPGAGRIDNRKGGVEQQAGRWNVLNVFPGRGTLSVKNRGEVEA